MKTLIPLFSFLAMAAAQQTVAPTPETSGTVRGENVSDYNIVDNVELGDRFATVGGNLEQYRSSVNFGNGIRLLGSYFSMNSRDGHGRYFDDLVITTQGLGNDPYESARVRLGKNRLYRYDMSWRRNNYVNPGLVTDGAGGQHLQDTLYTLQDHDLTLFPDSNLKFFLGFSDTTQTGPTYTSIQVFDDRGNIFPLFANLRRGWREYRLGNEFRVFGLRVNWMHGWQDFKEDTGVALANAVPGVRGVPAAGVTLSQYQSTQPYHGTSPYWRVLLMTDRKVFNINGRFTYTAGARGFVVNENSMGLTAFGSQMARQVLTYGNAERPAATGNVTLSFTPDSRLTVVNSTAAYNIRTEGNSVFSQFDNASLAYTILYFEYLGIRTVSNDTDVNYQVSPVFGLTGGYHYSDRRISVVDQFTVGNTPTTTPAGQSNVLQAGDIGFRIRPVKPLTIQLFAEIGRNNLPFTPVADKNYHALNGRLQYRLKTFSLTGAAQSSYNVNSTSLSAYSSQARTYSVTGNWTPRAWFSADAGYSRIHLYTIGGLAYLANLQLVTGQDSIFLSNINSTTVGARFAIRKRADLYLGFTRVQDVGDGRSAPDGAGIGSASPVFQAVQTFPVAFTSPLARVSFRINNRIRWNIGYQYYGYQEKFYLSQNFRAHTGYSSVSYSF